MVILIGANIKAEYRQTPDEYQLLCAFFSLICRKDSLTSQVPSTLLHAQESE
jgi:hypothetical protein